MHPWKLVLLCAECRYEEWVFLCSFNLKPIARKHSKQIY